MIICPVPYLENWETYTADSVQASRFIGIHSPNHFRTIFDCLSRMECSLLSGQTLRLVSERKKAHSYLTNNSGVLVDEDLGRL